MEGRIALGREYFHALATKTPVQVYEHRIISVITIVYTKAKSCQILVKCLPLCNFNSQQTAGNPSAIEDQTVNIKNLRTGLWA